MFIHRHSFSLLIYTSKLFFLILLLSLATVDLIWSNPVQASTRDTSFTYLPMVTKYITDLLDDTFGEDGKVFTDLGNNSERANSLAIQSDGKIILAGMAQFAAEGYDFVLLRYNPDGSLDASFDGDGAVITGLGNDEYAHEVAVQADGKIILAGSSSFPIGDWVIDSDAVLVRYNPDGSLDTSFDGDGVVVTNAGEDDYFYDLALQPDGKIVTAGWVADYDTFQEDLLLARYNPDGSPDTSFGGDGVIIMDYNTYEGIYALAIQPDGKVVAAGEVGENFAVMRFLSDGSQDTSFSEDGLFTIEGSIYWESAFDVLIQPDGRIIAVGSTYLFPEADVLLVRLSADGSLDPSFDGDGMSIYDIGEEGWCRTVALRTDGRIVVGGSIDNDFVLLRYLPDGSLDASFAKQGVLTTDFFGYSDDGNSLAIQPDGKIVLGGRARYEDNDYFALIRIK